MTLGTAHRGVVADSPDLVGWVRSVLDGESVGDREPSDRRDRAALNRHGVDGPKILADAATMGGLLTVAGRHGIWARPSRQAALSGHG